METSGAPVPGEGGVLDASACHPGMEPRAASWQCLGETLMYVSGREPKSPEAAYFKQELLGHAEWECGKLTASTSFATHGEQMMATSSHTPVPPGATIHSWAPQKSSLEQAFRTLPAGSKVCSFSQG